MCAQVHAPARLEGSELFLGIVAKQANSMQQKTSEEVGDEAVGIGKELVRDWVSLRAGYLASSSRRQPPGKQHTNVPVVFLKLSEK